MTKNSFIGSRDRAKLAIAYLPIEHLKPDPEQRPPA
jgi:hypothetical protein